MKEYPTVYVVIWVRIGDEEIDEGVKVTEEYLDCRVFYSKQKAEDWASELPRHGYRIEKRQVIR